MDDQILTFYGKGLSTREIVQTFKEMYDADVSATLISRVTDQVLEQITQWQSRPLDPIYPIVYLDCIVIKIRDKLRVINKAIYLALGVNMDGKKELLGLYILRPASSCASFTCYVIASNTSPGKTTRQSQPT